MTDLDNEVYSGSFNWRTNRTVSDPQPGSYIRVIGCEFEDNMHRHEFINSRYQCPGNPNPLPPPEPKSSEATRSTKRAAKKVPII